MYFDTYTVTTDNGNVKISIYELGCAGCCRLAFKLYKQRLLLVCEDNDVTENERIARKIKIGVGDEGLRRLNTSGLSDIDRKIPQSCGHCLRRS